MAKNKKEEVKVDLPATTKQERTIDQIQQEYAALATKSGQLNYQVFVWKTDVELLNKQMRDLNFEAAAIKGKEAQANA